MANTIVVLGPQGCGKTRHANALAKHYGCDKIVDELRPGELLTDGALHLATQEAFSEGDVTELANFGFQLVTFSAAMRAAGLEG